MKSKFSLPHLAIHLVASSLLISSASSATVVFDFRTNQGSGGALGADPAGADFDNGTTAGDTVTVGGLVATVVDVVTPEYDITGPLPVLTGNILSAAAGDAVSTNVSNQDALGINNPSIGNNDFDLLGEGSESSDINPGESLTFTFDQDVIFTEIELESVNSANQFDVLINNVVVLATMGDDSFIDDLGALAGLVITAGSEITFAVDGPLVPTGTTGDSTSIRIETFTVDVVPEPSSLALLALGGLMMAKRRRS